MRTEPDPKLVAIRKEIADIMSKHDICGTVILANQNAIEHMTMFEASWSCASIFRDEGGVGIKINSTNLPAETKKKIVESTLGMILGQRDLLVELLDGFNTITKMLEQQDNLSFEHVSRRV